MTREEILESLRILVETPPNIDCNEYWERVNKISEKEQEAFTEETKKLAMQESVLHRCFSL